MKESLLFGLCASFAFAPVAFAQNAPAMITPATQSVTDAVLQPVAGNTGVWTLGAGNYNVKDLLTILAAKTGGQAHFDFGFGTFYFVTLAKPLQGTLPKLIDQVIDPKVGTQSVKTPLPLSATGGLLEHSFSFEVVVAQVGADWVFAPRKPKTQALYAPPPDPIGFRFNINRSPRPVNPKNLPPNAVPFEFNGERVYYVPLPAKGK